jgi:hypothetical protein
MNRSIIWVEPERNRGDERSPLGRLRSAQFLPVPVESISAALHLLGQFQAGAVVVRPTTARDEYVRLIAVGSPVVALVAPEDAALVDHYLAAGCAAVVSEPCPFKVLQGILQRVASGERQVRWPEASVARAG